MYDKISERILECDDFAAYQRLVGGLKALEDAHGIPEVVLTKLEELREQRAITDESIARAESERRAGIYGTRRWVSPVASAPPRP